MAYSPRTGDDARPPRGAGAAAPTAGSLLAHGETERERGDPSRVGSASTGEWIGPRGGPVSVERDCALRVVTSGGIEQAARRAARGQCPHARPPCSACVLGLWGRACSGASRVAVERRASQAMRPIPRLLTSPPPELQRSRGILRRAALQTARLLSPWRVRLYTWQLPHPLIRLGAQDFGSASV